jgi:hypothetical protein
MGNKKLMESIQPVLEQLTSRGMRRLHLGSGDEVLSILALPRSLRSGSPQSCSMYRTRGSGARRNASPSPKHITCPKTQVARIGPLESFVLFVWTAKFL